MYYGTVGLWAIINKGGSDLLTALNKSYVFGCTGFCSVLHALGFTRDVRRHGVPGLDRYQSLEVSVLDRVWAFFYDLMFFVLSLQARRCCRWKFPQGQLFRWKCTQHQRRL